MIYCGLFMSRPLSWNTTHNQQYIYIHDKDPSCAKTTVRDWCGIESENINSVVMRTALDGVWGHLEREPLTRRLRNMNTEHQSDSSVLPPDVRFSFPQLDVGIPQLQDTSAVDSEHTTNITKQPRTCQIQECILIKSVFSKHAIFTASVKWIRQISTYSFEIRASFNPTHGYVKMYVWYIKIRALTWHACSLWVPGEVLELWFRSACVLDCWWSRFCRWYDEPDRRREVWDSCHQPYRWRSEERAALSRCILVTETQQQNTQINSSLCKCSGEIKRIKCECNCWNT